MKDYKKQFERILSEDNFIKKYYQVVNTRERMPADYLIGYLIGKYDLKFIGSGISRMVFKLNNDLIIKIDNGKNYNQNEREADILEKCKNSKFFPKLIAKSDRFIICEYKKGKLLGEYKSDKIKDEYDKKVKRAAKYLSKYYNLSIYDSHNWNIIVNKGEIFFIDLGGWTIKKPIQKTINKSEVIQEVC